jgi:P-type Cu+ transporter
MTAPSLETPDTQATHTLEDTGGHQAIEKMELARIAFVAAIAFLTWFHLAPVLRGFDLIALAGIAIGGYPVFKEAISNLLARRMTMELSMTIALLSATAIREYFTALVILLFVLIAEVLEELTVDRGRKAIRALLDLMPKRALVRRELRILDVPAEEVQPGEVVVVKPGSEIPVDGTVVHGHSFVNQASITGESLPAEKLIGGKVFAGTTNLNGSLEIRTVTVGRDTVFGKIIEVVERAEQSRAPIQKVADRLAGYLVYAALGAAVLTFLYTRNMRSTIAVIIVAGACGIAAGTPLAILGAIGQAARRGAIVKGGRYLEMLADVDTVVLDKTGTLTFGEPHVTEVRPAPGIGEEMVLEAAALAERLSEHPLAKAILNRASTLELPVLEPESFDYFPGKGIICSFSGEQILVGNRALLEEKGIPLDAVLDRADAGTEVLVSRGGLLLGSICVEDTLRPEAIEAVHQIGSMGIRTILLTGDAWPIAAAVGARLKVDEVAAELLPDQKLDWINGRMNAGRIVAMVGDGINDAPALSRASVGIAMGSGTEVARQSADVLLLGNNLMDFVATLRIARQCRGIIFANFTGTLLVDAVGVILAALGILNPLLAAFIHVTSELAFIGNSARLVPGLSSIKVRLGAGK